jgi:hypothetical protein
MHRLSQSPVSQEYYRTPKQVIIENVVFSERFVHDGGRKRTFETSEFFKQKESSLMQMLG